MKRIILGIIFIGLFLVLLKSAQMKEGHLTDIILSLSIALLLPGILLIKYGIQSILNKQEQFRIQERDKIQKLEHEQKQKRIDSCNHNFSSWSLNNVNPHYCGNYKVSQSGERVCGICGMVETCYNHDIQFVNSNGSLYDHIDNYRCTKCGYEFHINYDI